LRFFNLKDTDVDAILNLEKTQISKVWKTNLRETDRNKMYISDGKVEIHVKGKEIVTLLLK